MSATEQNDDQLQPPVEGPGKQLRDIRIAKELDIARVASLLHLDVELLESLEADNYQRMPGTVFVQGYLRNYARLLGTPAQPILDAFRSYRPAEAAESDLSMRHLKPEVRSSHTLVRLITWLIVIGILALVFTWWRGYLQWPLGLGLEQAVEQPAEPSPPQGELPAGGVLLPQPMVEPILEAEPETGTAAPDSGLPQVEPPVGLPASPAESTSPELQPQSATGDATEEVATEVSQQPVAPEPSIVEAPAEEVAPPVSVEEPFGQAPALPATAGGSVQVAFSDNCWTDIRDNSGEFRLIGNKTAGESYRLGGEPPYTMVFGNASAVTITVNGESYDLEPHVRGNVARVTLNPDS
ncbi:MAG: DUF4115 domain-containing protein [Sedimenticola sp.]|nr:DUF4115 domain-containing protein [Sedimenticola sp.]